MAGLKVSILGPEIGENGFFAPQIFRGHVWKPMAYRT